MAIVTATVEAAPGNDIRSQMAAKIVEKGWPLYRTARREHEPRGNFPGTDHRRRRARAAVELNRRKSMRGLYAIYRKEMGHYFVSPVAYVVVGVFLFLSGFFFNARWMCSIRCRCSAARLRRSTCPAGDARLSRSCQLLFLFLLPMLTMGVYAEERKRGTMELLMTSPITGTADRAREIPRRSDALRHHAAAHRRLPGFHLHAQRPAAAVAA